MAGSRAAQFPGAVLNARNIWLKLHRWSGLYLALFLIVAGVTGAVVAYYDEIEALLLPELFTVPPRATPRPTADLVRAVEEIDPRADVEFVPLTYAPGRSAKFFLSARVDPETGVPYALGFDQAFVDPYTAKILGTRLRNDLGFDAEHVVRILFKLHYSLLLGRWGELLFGIAAIIWTVNCFIGFYLTLPVHARRFFASWKRSWLVRSAESIWRFSFDFHRAAGLWLWLVLLVFAVSAVQMSLNEQVFRPLLTRVLPVEDPVASLPTYENASQSPRLGWEPALARGRELMAREAKRSGFVVYDEIWLSRDREHDAYVYHVRSSLDVRDKGGETRIYLSASDGRQLAFVHPSMASGNTVSSWLYGLHMALVWGKPYQAFVALFGLTVATLSITGVLVWYKRRAPSRRAPV